ncbi:MAG: ribose-5-phosphate isomerase RpiA [Candidatus Eisenbacteria bacterium]|nr:ribose-5-phosphate isomerase RpiA [Candidatus Eisenbacteria bacterium]
MAGHIVSGGCHFNMTTQEQQDLLKRQAATLAIESVLDGMIVGLGTGSTASWAVRLLGERVAKGLTIQGVPTSEATARLAREVGIPLVDFESIWGIDLTLDGADEVDSDLNMVKGGGGALLREKIVATASKELIIMVDPAKLVPRLGEHFPLPVEVTPFGWQQTARHLAAVGAQPKLRMTGARPFETDNRNFILDCRFPGGIENPGRTEFDIDRIPGVVESGLFVRMTRCVIVGYPDGARAMRKD